MRRSRRRGRSKRDRRFWRAEPRVLFFFGTPTLSRIGVQGTFALLVFCCSCIPLLCCGSKGTGSSHVLEAPSLQTICLRPSFQISDLVLKSIHLVTKLFS